MSRRLIWTFPSSFTTPRPPTLPQQFEHFNFGVFYRNSTVTQSGILGPLNVWRFTSGFYTGIVKLRFFYRSFDEASPRVKKSRVASSSSFPTTTTYIASNLLSPKPQTTVGNPTPSSQKVFSFDESQLVYKIPKVCTNISISVNCTMIDQVKSLD